ncbi:FAD-dependent oxidoreductase [Phytoactinopolyspora alkaliphila]|uniref:FAD-dependent oxidoreductase n=1 Tax=Phytoactinopolyspora alkaliphila TaxID=1783498 RepID=A0A6N9YNE2_9ACTN|nr:FAD-dependent oxidoreductase [Phytoactinopolyspora alkaliphila]NED96492.1 FAD-dependent oxidoreductase [Phytoactinopolyspora alkaliphila]
MTRPDADVLVVGGGVGGVAAALAAADAGATVILTETTRWIGGQFTAQAVPPDEHPWIEQFGGTASYRRFRDAVRKHYRTWYPLAEKARSALYLNPGNGAVSALCHEPRVALAVLQSMLAPHQRAGRLVIYTELTPHDVRRDGSTITSVGFRYADGSDWWLSGHFVLDATETGELLPLAGIPYVTGTESAADTGEPDAPEIGDPQMMQGFTVCFAMDHIAGENHVIDRPEQYDRWTAAGAPVRAAPQIGWPKPSADPAERTRRVLRPNPDPATDSKVIVSASHQGRFGDNGDYSPIEDIWRFRRLVARGNFEPAPPSDITLINCSANDYIAGSIVDVEPEVAAANLQGARQLSLSFFYWLQTEAPRADGGTGFPGLRLRGDVTGTSDGLAMAPYIREGRRLRALETITQNDIAASVRGVAGAREYHDSVGIGSYKIDLHPSTRGGERKYDPAWPFQIPLGALLSSEVGNLVAAAKNIGTTHITNGCYRVHPVEWNVGEAAGALAAFCVATGTDPVGVRESPARLTEFRRTLIARGVELAWPRVAAY